MKREVLKAFFFFFWYETKYFFSSLVRDDLSDLFDLMLFHI